MHRPVNTHLVHDGRHNIIEEHLLVCSGRKDLVKVVGLVSQCAGSH